MSDHVPGLGTPPPALSGRERLTIALVHPGRGQVITAFLLLLLGFAAVTQVKARDRDDTYAGARQSDLVSLINSLALSTSRTEGEIARLTETRDSLRNDANARETAIELAQQQTITMGLIVGTIPAIGPGIRITIHDDEARVPMEALLNGLSELRDAGAEAIEINGVRVVASTVLAEGTASGLEIGGVPLTAPYIVEVIGDTATLRSAVTFEGGLAFEVRSAGASLEISGSSAIEIASVVTVAAPQYAEPVAGE
jgi:uncharacterized protein YlxW (UPF0749 family)